jgi:hypothetical protein
VADWNGSVPQVTYTVSDGRSNGLTTATLDITVTPVVDIHDDSATTHAGVPVTIDVLSNDTFSNSNKTLTATTDGQHGTVTIQSGKVIYTPTDASYVGSDTFTYTVTSGGIAETATVSVTMTNSAPVVADRQLTTPEDTALVGTAVTACFSLRRTATMTRLRWWISRSTDSAITRGSCGSQR